MLFFIFQAHVPNSKRNKKLFKKLRREEKLPHCPRQAKARAGKLLPSFLNTKLADPRRKSIGAQRRLQLAHQHAVFTNSRMHLELCLVPHTASNKTKPIMRKIGTNTKPSLRTLQTESLWLPHAGTGHRKRAARQSSRATHAEQS